MILRGWRYLCAVAAAALVFQACATQVPSPASPPQLNAEIAALIARDHQVNSLQSSAIMEYKGPRGRLKAREQITLRRPASLRVEALSPLGVALVITANADQLAIFDPSKNTITRGAANAATLGQVAQLPMTPQAAVRLLLGLPPDPALLKSAPIASHEEQGMATVLFADHDGATCELDFTGGNLTTVRQTSADRVTRYEVDYSDYRDIGSLMFPHVIVASFPPTMTTLKLHYEQPRVDTVIPDSAFVLAPGPQTKELSLSYNSSVGAVMS